MKRKGFTLIELLAVIIILGILMLIAIPSVTAYINNSRKNTYSSTIHEVIKGTVARVNNGDLDMYDTDTTYYIPATAINLEGSKLQSPYGEIEDAYVVVTYDGESYDYYYVGKDKANVGIGTVTKGEEINKDKIATDIGNIDTTVGIGGRSKVVVFDKDLVAGVAQGAQSQSGSGESGGSNGGGSSISTAGTPVYFDPVSESPCSASNAGSGTCYKWYIVNEEGSKANILLDHSVTGSAWASEADYGSTPSKTNKGPITLLKNLKTATASWTRVPLLNYNYTLTFPDPSDTRYNDYEGYKGYESLSCTNGTCKIKNGTTLVTDLRARVITSEEVAAITNAEIDYQSATPSISQTWTIAGGLVYEGCEMGSIYYPCNFNNQYHVVTYGMFTFYTEYERRIGTNDWDTEYLGSNNTKLYWLYSVMKDDSSYGSMYTLSPAMTNFSNDRDGGASFLGSGESEGYISYTEPKRENGVFPLISIDKSLLTY